MDFIIGDASVAIDLIIFDKDGTLVDLHAPWGRWAEHIAESLKPWIPPEDFLLRFGWDAASGQVAPETPLAVATVLETRASVTTWLYDRGLPWTEAKIAANTAIDAAPINLAPAICPLIPLFDYLHAHGVLIAVATADDRHGVQRDLEPLGVLPYIASIITADLDLPSKPAPDGVFAACAATGVPVERALVIGDSVADLMMGRAAGVALTVGVLSGSGTHAILSPHADLILPSICDLHGLLRGQESGARGR